MRGISLSRTSASSVEPYSGRGQGEGLRFMSESHQSNSTLTPTRSRSTARARKCGCPKRLNYSPDQRPSAEIQQRLRPPHPPRHPRGQNHGGDASGGRQWTLYGHSMCSDLQYVADSAKNSMPAPITSEITIAIIVRSGIRRGSVTSPADRVRIAFSGAFWSIVAA